MNLLLIYFALPLATIILAAVLQKLIKSPILVAAIFFAIYLIVAFAVFDAVFLIAAIVYTFLAYVTAAIVKILCWFFRNCNLNCNCCRREEGSCRRENECPCKRNQSRVSDNVLTLSDGNEIVNLSNTNGCTCRIRCQNNNGEAFNNGYNRGYNNGYDNAYNFISNNGGIQAENNNNNSCQCCNRRRCR